MWLRKKRIYADAAASVLLTPAARHELERLLVLGGNPGSLHKEGVGAKRELDAARAKVAAAIGAHADEIVFTGSGTEANNLALQGTLRSVLQEKGECTAITTSVEHPSVLEPLRALTREGLNLVELPVESDGLVDPKALAETLNDETALVSVQLINSEVGTTQLVREIARTLRRARGDLRPLFHTDASQAPLWLDIKVERLGAELVTLDAQKVGGPKGVGCLYIKRGTELQPLIWGGGQERGLRSGTENVPLVGSFAVALQEAQTDVEARTSAVTEVRDYLWSEIKKLLPDVALHGPELASGRRVPNNLNFSVPGLDGQMAVVALDAMGVAISTRSACSSGEEEQSHVLTALGVAPELIQNAVRVTLLPDATRGEAGRIAQALAEAAERYKVDR